MGSNAPNSDIHSENIVQFETVVRPIPQYDPSNPYMISQGPSLCIFTKEDEGEVLASWLFMQYMLTNDVQIAYSQTEGYIPVTSKAQNSDVYQEYLSLEGADNNLHYDVKIKAAKLFLSNIDRTFVTPVFAGSASVREAAGELVENVTRSVRRKKTVDDEFITQMYEDTAALKHLDQITVTDTKSFGPLPKTSAVLLVSLVFVWTVLIGIFIFRRWKATQEG